MFNQSLVCLDSGEGWLGLLDFSLAPDLMFYSYFPIVFLVLFFAGYVHRNSRTIFSRLLLLIAITFSIWIFLEFLNWTAISVVLVSFTWQLLFIIIPLIFLLSLLFFYNFIFEKNLDLRKMLIVLLAFLPIIFLLPSEFNFSTFDIYNCENVDGIGWLYVYAFDLFCILSVCLSGIVAIKESGKINRIKKLLATLATVVFLSVLFVTTTFADFTYLYEFNLLGPLGMLVFVILTSYLIVRYGAFNIKTLGSQFLIFALVFANFSLFFVQDIVNARIIILITLIITVVIGEILFRSIRFIEKQKQELAISNDNQEKLLHFITHQVKSNMTKSRNIFAGLIEGDYGRTTKKVANIANIGLKNEEYGIETVQNILKASDLKKGVVELKKEKFSVSEILSDIISKSKIVASEKGLNIVENVSESNVFINGDKIGLSEVFKNLINNAILYTQEGEIEIYLSEDEKQIIFSVEDTGVGISDEDMKNLFTEGGKGKDSLKYNINSTGYGLFIARQIIRRHNGDIHVHSEGQGKGSKFSVILPK